MVVGILLRLECGAAPLCMDHASATVTDFCSWSEAWSVYAAAFSSFHPHLATRLFQYQQFLALKSRSFKAAAWLRYDSEFRLKLAANGSWRFDVVDTELGVSVPLAILQATARLLRRSCPMIAGLRRRCRSCERFAAGWRGVASRGRVYSWRLVGLLPGGVP